MRKIFFFDLDGSMLDTAKGEYALPPKIINCIKLLRSNGNITSVCTARPKQFVKNNLPNIFDCYILLNGSYVEADNKILIDTPFSSEDLANITHRFNSLNISYILIGNYSCRACNISNSYKDILNQIYMSGQSYTHFSTSNEDKFYAIDLFLKTMQNMNVLIHICAQIKELQSTIFKAILLPIYLLLVRISLWQFHMSLNTMELILLIHLLLEIA